MAATFDRQLLASFEETNIYLPPRISSEVNFPVDDIGIHTLTHLEYDWNKHEWSTNTFARNTLTKDDALTTNHRDRMLGETRDCALFWWNINTRTSTKPTNHAMCGFNVNTTMWVKATTTWLIKRSYHLVWCWNSEQISQKSEAKINRVICFKIWI